MQSRAHSLRIGTGYLGSARGEDEHDHSGTYAHPGWRQGRPVVPAIKIEGEGYERFQG